MLTVQTKRSTLSITASKSQDVTQEECFATNDTRSSKRFIGIDLTKDHCDVACYDWCGKCVEEWARISYPELFEKPAKFL